MHRPVVAFVLALVASPALSSAEIQLSGQFRYEPSSMEGEQICFFPDTTGQKAVLSAVGMSADEYGHNVWFCFSDTASAASRLGLSLKLPPNACGFEGQAKVTVANYLADMQEGDGNDFADLVSVQERTGVKAITECEVDPFAP